MLSQYTKSIVGKDNKVFIFRNNTNFISFQIPYLQMAIALNLFGMHFMILWLMICLIQLYVLCDSITVL